ncbi:MAG TPA: DUF229 domain-containing protein [Verrucomicrobiales bacterium]|nr:DUF229 domain-containing protein [Verrucomicrobiales bacterium]HIL72085.1 DUF229 domain-containing protein [Verrucomicrobiota bacterium]
MKRPNILLLISHDLGCHIGPYGNAADQSPNLNRLASESMLFDSHFVTSPGCSQSRSSLVTGRYPHSNGQFGLANWGWKMHEDERLLPAVLKEAGYHSGLIGVWHLHPWTLGAFTSVSNDVSTTDRSPEGFADVASFRAEKWIEQEADSNTPFYLHVGFWEVHRPFCGSEAQEKKADQLEKQRLPIPDYLPRNTPTQREFAELHQSVGLVDDGVGRIMKALERKGIMDNTIVLFTADHGLPFPRAKGTLYDPGVQVALMARWPQKIKPGSHFRRLTSNVDVMPTLLEAAGVEIPEAVQGTSFLSEMTNPDSQTDKDIDPCIFAEKTYHEHYDPIRCIRTATHKYIRNFAERPRLVLPSDIYNSPTRISITDDESIWSNRPEEELYYMDDDSLEQNNRITDLDSEAIGNQLRDRLKKWMKETGDPLLDGPIARHKENGHDD